MPGRSMHPARGNSFLFLLALLLGALFSLPALSRPSDLFLDSTLQFHRLTMDEGLPAPNVFYVHEDRDGFIWLGTVKGASRFDGLELRTIQLGITNFFYSDSRGRLWIGAKELVCIDPTQNNIRTYHIEPNDATLTRPRTVLAITEDGEGNIWICHDRGIDKLDPATGHFGYVRHPLVLLATSLAYDGRGHLWVGTRNSVVRLDTRTLEVTPVPLKPGGTWVSIGMMPDGRIWACANQFFGLYAIDPQTFKPTEILENGKPIDAVRVIFDSLQNMYVGTLTGGLKIFLARSRTWLTLRHHPNDLLSIPSDHIHALCIDRAGNLWLGTAGGLCWAPSQQHQFNYLPYNHDKPRGPPEGYIRSVTAGANHTVWIGSWGGGLVRFDVGSKSFSPMKAIGKRIHATCVDPQGHLWVSAGGSGELRRVDQRTGTSVRAADVFPSLARLHQTPISALTTDSDGNLLLGLEGISLACLRLANGELHVFALDAWTTPGAIAVRQLIRDSRGLVWIAGGGSGIVRLDLKTGEWKRLLFERMITSVIEDRSGRLWIGSDVGLDLLDRSTGQITSAVRTLSLGSGEGLVDIIEDGQGVLWLVGEYHLFRFDPGRNSVREFGPWQGYPITSHGLHLVRGTRSAFASDDGLVVLGTANGIVTFKPEWISERGILPRVVISDILVSEADSSGAGVESLVHFALPDRIDLPYDRSALQIHCAVLDYTSPESNQIEVRLEGLDKDWVRPHSSGTVYYGGFQPGSYLFRVRGTSSDGTWDSTGASLRIVVHPPFWRTWWFYVLASAFVVILAISLTRIRYIRQLQLERMRLRIANDLHDEVGSSLSSIALLTDLVHDGTAERGQEQKDLREISAKARGTAETLRDIVWVINPEHDRPERLVDRMKDNARSCLGALPFTFETNIADLNERFDIEVRRHLLLAYKELLNNVVRHAHARRVKIGLWRDGERLILRVADDGIGFQDGRIAEGNGIPSLRTRAKELKGTLNIRETPGGGTTVELIARIP